VFGETGFPGLVLRNEIGGVEIEGREISVGAGESLSELIRRSNQAGLAGLERMYGIPGTVGGAVVGNAGAYGQEIGPSVVQTEVWEDGRVLSLSGSELAFAYRSSALKGRRGAFLLRCRLRLVEGAQEDLQATSDEILATRLAKFPADLKCPGSFFKNVPLDRLPPEARVPADFVVHGKVPAGRLLEAVGAQGQRRGGAVVATYHGNLVVNEGAATADDVLTLTSELADRVLDRFGVRLEREVVLVDGPTGANLFP
jgi:UDP-N-acetylmuramate dehydrogenase